MRLDNRTGWRPSPKSPKDADHPLQSIGMANATVPSKASLEGYINRVDDQRDKPWCVAFGVCNAIEYQRKVKGLGVPVGGFSKAYLYARCKQLDGIPGEDGTYVKTALWVALNEGLLPDYLCPTDEWLERDDLPPITAEMRAMAAKYRIKGFSRLQDTQGYVSLHQIKQAISSGGYVVIASIVDMDWLDGDDILDKPEGEALGGHCTYLYDYDDMRKRVELFGMDGLMNSWGRKWGREGRCDMSYAYARSRYEDGTPSLLEAWAFSVGEPQPKRRCGICEWFRRWFS